MRDRIIEGCFSDREAANDYASSCARRARRAGMAVELVVASPGSPRRADGGGAVPRDHRGSRMSGTGSRGTGSTGIDSTGTGPAGPVSTGIGPTGSGGTSGSGSGGGIRGVPGR